MSLYRKIRKLFNGGDHGYVELLSRQTEYLVRTTSLLYDMFSTADSEVWEKNEKEIKSCEVLGDALLTEFHEQLYGSFFMQVSKLDLQAVSMAIDDCLDVSKDTSKALLIYGPQRVDDQLQELARIAKDQSEAIHDLIPLLANIKRNLAAIQLGCDRVTEQEHAADDSYEEYVGYIFKNVEDMRELTKDKNLAEMLENVTDVHKKISDNVRKMLLGYLTD